MKTNHYTYLLALLLCFFSLVEGKAQKAVSTSASFEGTITMQITALNLPEDFKPYESKITGYPPFYSIKGKKTRVDISNENDGFFTIIYDRDAEQTISYTIIDNRKIACIIKDTISGTSKLNTEKHVPTTENKKVEGHLCTKGTYTKSMFGIPKESELWVCPEIQNNTDQFSLAGGMPLEYTSNIASFSLIYKAVKVKEEKIDDGLFILPEDYEVLDEKEFKRITMAKIKP